MASDSTKDFVAGIAAGVALVLTGHPFDTIKVKLQAQNGSGLQFRGPLQCTSHVLRYEGVPGLYRGAASSFLGVSVESSLLFGTYTQMKKMLMQSDSDTSSPSFAVTAVSAGTAGAIISLVLCPTELIKCRLQVLSDKSQSSAFKHSPTAVPTPGQPATSARQVASSRAPFHSLTTPAAAAASAAAGHGQQKPQQQRVAAVKLGTAPACPPSSIKAPFHSLAGHLSQQQQQQLGSIRSAGTALTINHPARFFYTHVPHAAALQQVYTPSRVDLFNGIRPIQVGIKALPEAVQIRRMSQAAEVARHITYTGTWDCFVKTLRYEGVSGIFRGLVPTAMRETVGNICFFAAYEWVRPRVMSALHCEEEPLPTIVGTPVAAHHHHHHHSNHSHHGSSHHEKHGLEHVQVSAVESPVLQHSAGREDAKTRATSKTLLDHPSGTAERRREGGADGQQVLLPAADRTAGSNAAAQGSGGEGGTDLRKAAAEAVAAVLSGGMAGIAFWIAVLPFDVIKTRIQTDTTPESRNVLMQFQSVLRAHGARGLYSGLGPTLARAFPANAAAVLAWELTARLMST